VTLRYRIDEDNSRAVRDNVIDKRQLTAATALRELSEVRAIPVCVGRERLWVRTDIQGHAALLLQRLVMRVPQRLLKPESVVAQTPGVDANA
jgi:hypothetical protein